MGGLDPEPLSPEAGRRADAVLARVDARNGAWATDGPRASILPARPDVSSRRIRPCNVALLSSWH